MRDLVLGLEAVLADGTTVRFGGRTMKNVAGYDMSKLFIGSFGALGVITEITFRLIPQSDTQGLMILPFTAIEEAQRIVSAILDSPLQPLVLAAVSPDVFTANDAPRLPDSCAGPKALGLLVSSAAGAEGILLAGFAGHEAAVARSLSDVSAWAKDGAPAVLRDEEAEAVLDAVAGLGEAAWLYGRVFPCTEYGVCSTRLGSRRRRPDCRFRTALMALGACSTCG